MAAFLLYGDVLRSYLFPSYQAGYAGGEGAWRGEDNMSTGKLAKGL